MLDTKHAIFKEEKFCHWCKTTKSCDDFGWRYVVLADGGRAAYLRPYCVSCTKAYDKLRRQTKPQGVAAYATVG